MKHTFIYSENEYPDCPVEISISAEEVWDWPTLTDYYIRFLRACGYVFSADNVKELLADQLIEIAEAEEGCDDGSEEHC